MESDDMHRTTQGKYPGCGAIFMSSCSTKNECFKRRLFGLPSEQGPFVKRVKKGMILFLFEFEKRELHGVFQACSDGAMDISRSAWTASGKTFPAQVRVRPIWRCHPLPESEFGDAIKENYFSKRKFNFGLSEAQVWRLLTLFNLQKLKTPRPQRALTRDTAAKLVDTRDIDGKLDASDKSGNTCKVDNELHPIIRRRYQEELSGIVERDHTMYGDDAYLDLHHGALSSIYNTRSGQFERGRNLAVSGSVSHSDGFHNPGLPFQETYPSVQDTKRFSHLMELPIINNSYAASHGDAIIENGLPYVSGTNLEDSRIVGNYDSVPHYEGHNEIPTPYSLSPSNYPSFLVDHRYPMAIQNKPLHEIGAFNADGPSLEDINCQLPCGSHSDRILRSDSQESRKSVFSRLGFSTPGGCQENLGHPGHEENVNDTPSVDEVMAMLHESGGSWMKPNKPKLFKNIKQNSKLETIPDKLDSDSASPTGDEDHQSSMDTFFLDFKRRNRKVHNDIISERARGEEMKAGQGKRRKLIRPNFSENEPRTCEDAGSAEISRKCEASSGKKRKLAESNSSGDSSAQCSGEAASGKRKKLARPSFGENDSALLSSPQCSGNTRLDVQASHDKLFLSEDADFKKQVRSDCRKNAVELLQGLPSECSSGEFAGKNYEAFVGSQGNINVHTQRFTKSEMEIKRESSGECQKVGDESGNDPVGSQIVSPTCNQHESSQLKISGNAVQEFGMESALVGTVIPDTKNSILARLSDNISKTDQRIMQESLTQQKTNTGTSGTSVIELDTGREREGLQMVELVANEIASNCADDNMVNNQRGVGTKQLQSSGNSLGRRPPQEDGSNSSKNNVVENVEFDLNKALNNALNENKKLRNIIRGRGLLFFRDAQQH